MYSITEEENKDAEESVGFIIDAKGTNDINSSDDLATNSDNPKKSLNPFLEEIFKDCEHVLKSPLKQEKHVPKNPLLLEVLTDLGLNEDGTLLKRKPKKNNLLKTITDKEEVKKALEKSVITPEFEKLHVVPPLEVSEKKLKEQRKKERDLTKGKNWFGMPATELTEENKRDLEILKMRSVLDPKHFYKKNDLKVLPKYFQIGKVMDSPLDFYSDRVPKKLRKKTLVDELLADAEFNKYNKRKYKEILEEKQKTHYKAWRQAKRLKKKKK